MNKADELRRLAAPITDVYIDLENRLMVNISKYLSGDNNAAGTAQWNLEKLRELSRLRDSNYKIIADSVKGLDESLFNALKEAGAINDKQILLIIAEAQKLGLLGKSVFENDDNPIMARILDRYYQSAKSKLNLANTTLLNNASQNYVDIINKTTGAVLTGVDTPQNALRNAVKEFADKGIPALVDRAGRKWTPEAYVDNVIRSTSNNVANDIQFARMDEYEIDLVEVSSHMGARPKCEPYQGRIFSRSGKSKKYASWDSTSYGDAGGLLGCNCRHSVYPFVEGVSVQRYTPYDETANAESYANSQKQRLIERGIRAAKREKEMFDALGDSEGSAKAAQKIKGKQANMREFISETGLPRQRHREQIYAPGAKPLTPPPKGGIIGNKGVNTMENERTAAGLRRSKFHVLTDDEINSLKDDIKAIDADVSIFRFNKGSSTSYRPDLDIINVKGNVLPDLESSHPRDKMSARAVLAHEYYGHRAYRDTKLPKDSWNDEFRASYFAAKNAPNLSDEDRMYLIADAVQRAKDAGVSIKYNELMRRYLYGIEQRDRS